MYIFEIVFFIFGIYLIYSGVISWNKKTVDTGLGEGFYILTKRKISGVKVKYFSILEILLGLLCLLPLMLNVIYI